jgi:hypothetical protein
MECPCVIVTDSSVCTTGARQADGTRSPVLWKVLLFLEHYELVYSNQTCTLGVGSNNIILFLSLAAFPCGKCSTQTSGGCDPRGSICEAISRLDWDLMRPGKNRQVSIEIVFGWIRAFCNRLQRARRRERALSVEVVGSSVVACIAFVVEVVAGWVLIC